MTYQWLLRVSDDARKQLGKLPSHDRMAVFRSIAELCTADDPHALSQVVKLREKRFEGQYRRRQGYYRLFFSAEKGQIQDQKHVYQGVLWIHAILHRKDAYR